jgi:hypothetical protein
MKMHTTVAASRFLGFGFGGDFHANRSHLRWLSTGPGISLNPFKENPGSKGCSSKLKDGKEITIQGRLRCWS